LLLVSFALDPGNGIMNILLILIAERTRKIGLRIAIGARRLHVRLHFLAEAVFPSVSGGGGSTVIAMGVAFSAWISLVFSWRAAISSRNNRRLPFSTAVGVSSGSRLLRLSMIPDAITLH
jgi:macrolide transport system ATP-binding/permease protein